MGCGACRSLDDSDSRSIIPTEKLFTVVEEQAELEESRRGKTLGVDIATVGRINTKSETLGADN